MNHSNLSVRNIRIPKPFHAFYFNLACLVISSFIFSLSLLSQKFRAFNNDDPKTLLAVSLTFPAKLVIGHSVSRIQKKCTFQLFLFAHSWHIHHLHFLTQAVRRGYVTAASPDCRSCPIQAAWSCSFHRQGVIAKSYPSRTVI